MANVVDWPDILTLVLYFVIVLGIGIGFTFKGKKDTANAFFLAGRSMKWYLIAGSIFAANIGAPTFVGLAGSAAATGMAPVMFEWHATYMLVLLGWIFAPVYMSSGTYTMPEYLSKRFGGTRIRVYYAIIQLLLSILTGVSSELYAGSLFVKLILGWNIYPSVILILIATGIYSIGGGLSALIYTDTIQAVVLIVGSAVLAGISIGKVGGFEAMRQQYMVSAANYTYAKQAIYGNVTCGFPPKDAFHIFRSVDSDYPWPGLVFGLTILAGYFFCTNQTIVQRTLSAKTTSDSKLACVVASYLKILPFFLFVLPGMVSRVMFPQVLACAEPDDCRRRCGNPSGCSNMAFPLLVLRVMPTGLKGLMLAGLLAALMSSLAANFNGSSSIFTMDIFKRFRPKASEREVVLVGRLFGILMIVIAILWLPVLQAIQGSQLWNYLQSMSAYITPPWVVIFVLGLFWKRTSEKGAWWGLMAGLVTGLTRMGIHFSYVEPNCGQTTPDVRPAVFTKVHYLHFALILAGVTLIVTVCVTLVTPPRSPRKLHRRTWWTRHDEIEPDDSDDEREDEADAKATEDALKNPKAFEVKEAVVEGKVNPAKRVWRWLIGYKVDAVAPPKLSQEEKKLIRSKLNNINESPVWQRVCNINAVIVVAATCFIIGFWA